MHSQGDLAATGDLRTYPFLKNTEMYLSANNWQWYGGELRALQG